MSQNHPQATKEFLFGLSPQRPLALSLHGGIAWTLLIREHTVETRETAVVDERGLHDLRTDLKAFSGLISG